MSTSLHALPSETIEGSSDADLVAAAQLGDRRAFGVLVERHQHLIWSIAYCLTGSAAQSEEVSQETFVTAWSRLAELRDRQSFKGWLRKIAQNFSMMSHRDRRGQRFEELTPTQEATASSEPSPLDHLIEREQAWLLRRALQQIPDAYRLPLVLFYRQDKSVESVAATLDVSEDAVRQRLTRARKLLRDEVFALMEPLLARRRPAGQFTALVLVAISGVAGGNANAGPAAGHALAADRRPLLLKGGAVALLGTLVVAAVPWLTGRVGTKAAATSSSTGGAERRQQEWAATLGRATGVTPQTVAPSLRQDESAATQGAAGAESSTTDPLMEFNFEDGLQPSVFSQGQVVATPPGATSRFCVIGTIRPEYPGQHVEVGVSDLNLAFSRTKVLTFDYWASADWSLIKVSFGDDKQQNYGVVLRNIVRESWGHVEIRFVDLQSWGGLRRQYEEGARIARLSVEGGAVGGGPFYVDNLKLDEVPR